MKTTLDIPDELMRTIKVRAAQEDRKLKDVVASLLQRGLAATDGDSREVPALRVTLPLIHCAHAAAPGDELTPERVAAILQEQEVTDLTD